MNSWAIMPFGSGAEVFTWFFRGRLHHPRAVPTSKGPECRGLESNSPRDRDPPVPGYPDPRRPRPALPVCPALRGPRASEGTERGAEGWRHPTPQRAFRVRSRGLSSKRTSARWPTRPAPARRVLKVGRPFHKVKGTRKGRDGA